MWILTALGFIMTLTDYRDQCIAHLRECKTSNDKLITLRKASQGFGDLFGEIALMYSGDDLPNNDFGDFVRGFMLIDEIGIEKKIAKLKKDFPSYNEARYSVSLEASFDNYLTRLTKFES